MNNNKKQVTVISYDGKNLPPSCEMVVTYKNSFDSTSREVYHRTERKKVDLPPSCK